MTKSTSPYILPSVDIIFIQNVVNERLIRTYACIELYCMVVYYLCVVFSVIIVPKRYGQRLSVSNELTTYLLT